jgi:hypothetical protein
MEAIPDEGLLIHEFQMANLGGMHYLRTPRERVNGGMDELVRVSERRGVTSVGYSTSSGVHGKARMGP